MKTRGKRQSVALLLWLLIIRRVKTGGKLDIRFIKNSSDGRTMSGDCCDSRSDGRNSCPLYQSTTDYIDNQNSSIKIQVLVYDYDGRYGQEHMDTLSKLINIQAAPTEQTAIYTPYILRGRTGLKIAVRANCDTDWYGSSCERYCNATDIVNITLLGEIDHTNRGDLAEGTLFTELGAIAGKVDVSFTTIYVQLYCAMDNGSSIESPLQGEIFESNPQEVINEYLPLPLHPEEKTTLKNPLESWNTNQYVSVILPPVGLLTVLLVVAFCVYRRRAKNIQQRRDNNQLSSFVMDVPCNPQPPSATTGNCQEASVSPDGYRSLHFPRVDERSHDTHCDDTSNVNLAAEDMTFDPEGFGFYPDDNARLGKATHSDFTSNIHLAAEDMTLDDVIAHCFRVSTNDKTRPGDAATLGPNCDDTTKLRQSTEDMMTHYQVILHGLSACTDDKASLGDMTTLQQVTNDLTLDPVILRDARASPHDTTGPGDEVATPDTHCDETSGALSTTEYGTFDSVSPQKPSENPNDHTRLGEVGTRRHVTSYIHPVPGDIVLEDEDEEEDAEYTVIHDNDVKDLLQEDPYETIESLDDNDAEDVSQTDPFEKTSL